VVGEVADLANAAWYTAEGDYTMAALSAAAAIPFVGWAATGAKAGRVLYRGMTEASGTPQIGAAARTLGARPGPGRGTDIPVDPQGMVHPGTGGMSVAPDSAMNLPRHRRPPEFEGTGRDPVWSIQEKDLGPDLRYVPDPGPRPTHGVIEPSRSMPIDDYQQALGNTAERWKRQ